MRPVFGVMRLYGETAVLAFRRGVRAWPVMFSLVLYAAIFMVVSQLVTPLGRAGGFVVGLVLAACFSSYIHLISQVVSGSKVRFADLKQSFGARFFDVISVLFAFWIIDLILTIMVAPAAGPKGPIVMALFGLAMAVLFNPVPELLYLGSSRSFQLLFESGRFISKHGLEWLLPNILFAVALLAPLGMLHGPAGLIVLNISALLSPNNDGMGLYALFSRAPLYLQLPMLIFVHFVMVFRGLL
ncbi:MAG: hypothetical protein H7X95_06185, partial [Deltaproteobacteria bacterium]|nr:hypothetical protein [Deltaproteobacteria bacterium]